eukprot:768267-Hanusia_phi.AAC.4
MLYDQTLGGYVSTDISVCLLLLPSSCSSRATALALPDSIPALLHSFSALSPLLRSSSFPDPLLSSSSSPPDRRYSLVSFRVMLGQVLARTRILLFKLYCRGFHGSTSFTPRRRDGSETSALLLLLPSQHTMASSSSSLFLAHPSCLQQSRGHHARSVGISERHVGICWVPEDRVGASLLRCPSPGRERGRCSRLACVISEEREKIREAIKEQVREEAWEEIGRWMEKEGRGQVWEDVKGEIQRKLGEEVRQEAGGKIEEEVEE